MTSLPLSQLDEFIDRAIQEDVGSGDHTSLACIPAEATNRARLLVKDDGIIAGVDIARRIFSRLDPNAAFTEFIADGAAVEKGDIAFEVNCSSRALLMGERLALNVMQRMSGIATLSRRYADEVADLPVTIIDTRKTTPLLRFLEKWAVRLGGCANYRDGLYDWFMIKDNHIDACGGVSQAIRRVEQYQQEKGLALNVTVEVRDLKELEEVLQTGKVTRIMLDNFDLAHLREAVRRIDGRFETEASGGITLDNLRQMAETGVDYISVGALTHSAGSMDLSLKITG